LYILSFLLLIAAIGLSLQYSYASVDEEDEESDSEDSEVEEGSEGDSNEESNEEESNEEEETTNDTVTNQTTPPKVKPSDVFPTNQTLVQTLNQSVLSDGVSPAEIGPPAYRVKTTFYNIIVHNDHDGLARGNGEWDLFAFVQGIKVPLTEKSCRTNIITTAGSVPDCGLGSIEGGGGDAHFADLGKPLDSGTSVTVDLPRTVPLSIFTAGIEEDDCGRAEIPDEKEQQKLMLLMRDERLNWIEPIRDFIGSIAAIANAGSSGVGGNDGFDPICGYSDLLAGSDKLGNIVRFYEPIDYGKSDRCIQDKSDSGDYTLCYRITVTPLQSCPGAHIPEIHTYCKK
jgi:hypothetical protein